MFIHCPNCRNNFSPTKIQEKFIKESIEKRMTLIMIQCELCHHTIPFNPLNMNQDITSNEELLRCPVIGCYGYVSLIEKDEFGCGECGNIWESKKDLFNDIRKIITKYPYRANVYIFEKSSIKPVSLIAEPKNYNDMVRKELFE